MRLGKVELATLAWLVAGPVLAIVLNAGMFLFLGWAFGLGLLASSAAERHPADTVRYRWYARLGWTAAVFAIVVWMWVESSKVEGGELGAFFLTLPILSVWLVGLITVGAIVRRERRALHVPTSARRAASRAKREDARC